MIRTALVAALAALAVASPAHADPGGTACNPRYDACNAPIWCETTGRLLPPFSGFCPIGPVIYPEPWVS